MKKGITGKIILSAVITAMLALCSVSAVFTADVVKEDYTIYLNGEQMTFDTDIVTLNDRTMVPMRKLFETLGANVMWDEDTQSIFTTSDIKTIAMQIDNTTAMANNITLKLEAEPILYGERTLVPLRFVAEQLHLSVDFDEATGKITMTDKGMALVDTLAYDIYYDGKPMHVIYTGECVNGKADGVGVEVGKFDGDDTEYKCEGVYKDGKSTGYATVYVNGKKTYAGFMEDGIYNGYGITYDAEGNEEYNGMWINGQKAE